VAPPSGLSDVSAEDELGLEVVWDITSILAPTTDTLAPVTG